MNPNEKVFKLNPTSLGMKIKDLAKRAGLDDFHCHSLRHKFCTDLLERGVDLRVVQQLMGHVNLNTTQVYLAVTDKRLREAVNLLESDGKNPTYSKTLPKTGDNTPTWVKELDKIANNGKNYFINRDGSLEEA